MKTINKVYEIWKYVELTKEWVLDRTGDIKTIVERHKELKEKQITNYIRSREA